MTTTLSQAATLIRATGTTVTYILRGQPGIGKSAILKMLATEMPDYLPCYVDVTNLDLGDIGMPVVDREAMVTHYAPNARFGISRNQRRPVLLMLDELTKGSRAVTNMLLPTILERRLGDVPLPTGSIVFATGNLDTDGTSDSLQAHAYNRMTELVIANPTCDEWLQWATANDIAPEVMAFAKQNPEVFNCYADLDRDVKNPYIFNPLTGNTRTFCSPRSLEKASNITKARAALGDAYLPALAGTIGAPAAQLMVALTSLADSLPLYENIVRDPKGTKVPGQDSVAASFILAFMLAGRVSVDDLDAVMTYAERIPSFEAYALFLSTIASNKAKVGFACRNRAFTTACAKIGKLF